jgi:hypothetical protein
MTLMKNILRSSLASIAYLRYLFPEENFSETQLAGLKIKSLVPKQNPEIAAMTSWLENGVFDAIERHYLRALVFSVFAEFNNPATLLESYTFKFAYPSDGQMKMNLVASTKEGETKEMTYMSREQIQQAWCTMIRGLITLSHTLPPLPSERHIAMRLFYYDDITPEDYEPPGFQQSTDAADFEFLADAETIEIGGAVKTKHHTISLRLDTAMPNLAAPPDAGDSLSEQAKQVLKSCARHEFLTRLMVAEAIGQTLTSKRVDEVIGELIEKGVLSEAKGPRGRAIIRTPETESYFQDLQTREDPGSDEDS